MTEVVHRTFSIFTLEAIVWIVCIVLSLFIIYSNCSAGMTTGYIGTICSKGIGLVDIVLMIFFAPLYLIMLLIMAGMVNGGWKFW